MSSQWNSYTSDRKIKKFEGYIVIVPSSFEDKDKENIPIFCDICEFKMSPHDDDAYKKFGCCSICADVWAYSNKEKWNKGWRPSNDEIVSCVEKRILMNDQIRFE